MICNLYIMYYCIPENSSVGLNLKEKQTNRGKSINFSRSTLKILKYTFLQRHRGLFPLSRYRSTSVNRALNINSSRLVNRLSLYLNVYDAR